MSLLATVVTLLLLGLAAATPVGAQGARGTTVPTAGGEVTVFADRLEEIGPDNLLVASGNVEIISTSHSAPRHRPWVH